MTGLSVAVIVTCHDLDRYLNECIQSVTNQTMQPTELIIVHDGCMEPSKRYTFATNIYHGKTEGVARARHEGVLLSRSQHILFLDADDCLDEYFIESMVKTKVATKASIIYPNVLLWSNWSAEHPMRNAWHESPDEITWEKMMEYNQVVVTSLIPRSVYNEVEGFGNEPILEDYAFFLKCMREGSTFAKSKQSVLRYRQRENGRNRRNNELKNQWYYQIKERYEKS